MRFLQQPRCLGRMALLVSVVLIIAQFEALREFAVQSVNYLQARDFDGFRQFIRSYGYWAPAGSLLIMLIQSIFPIVPGLIVTMANAWVFGWIYGGLLSWTGALLGASCDFLFARWYGRPVVEYSFLARYLPVAECYFARYGVLSLFIARLIPIIPFKAVSYSAGIARTSGSQFLLATGLGQAGPIALYSYLGADLAGNPIFLGGAILFFLLIGTVLYFQRDAVASKFCQEKQKRFEE